MTYFVYILLCADDTLYTGITNDLRKRLLEHNTSKTGAKYTRSRRPVTIVYQEKKRTRGAALKREARIKQLSREEKLVLIKGATSTN